MGGRGKGFKKKGRVIVFVLKWMDKSIDGEPNKSWLKADAPRISVFHCGPLVKYNILSNLKQSIHI